MAKAPITHPFYRVLRTITVNGCVWEKGTLVPLYDDDDPELIGHLHKMGNITLISLIENG